MPFDQNFNYYTTHDFHSNYDINDFSSHSKSFAALNCNIRSLQGNHDNLVHMLSELQFPFSVIGLSEIKFKFDKDIITNVNIPGYDFISQPSLSNAGGVGFYIKNNLTFAVLSELSVTEADFEALWIEINCDGQSNLICGVVYRHSNGNLDNFMDYINKTIEKVHLQTKNSLIMGDFNIDLLNSCKPSNDFINTLASFFYQPHILQPTRITDHTATLIDNIFFNSIEHFTISGNIVYDLTDHLANFIILSNFGSLPSNIKVYKRDYSKLNESTLISEMQSIDWHSIFTSDSDPSDMFCSFYSTISDIVDKHIPLKQLSKKELKFQSKPWITPAIKVSIQVKNKLYKKYLKTKSCYFHSKFKLYRNKLNHLLKLSKLQYYNNYFLNNVKDIKKIWNGIKQIIHFKPSTNQRTIKIATNNNVITDPHMIADAFNNFFANIGKDLACSIPNVEMSPLEYLKIPLCNSFFIFPTTAEEIETEITKLKSSKAAGPFSIPVIILKILKTVISKPLEVLFNASFETGIVPDSFKLANVIPVYKKGSQTSLSNYRPISLLSVFDKLLEKLMCNRLVNFLEKKKIIFDNQFGFRSKHSTGHAILSIVDKIQRAIDERDFSCGIFLDFSKAFDTINHEILLKKT